MSAKIKFGTSGWRAVIADEFTFENVRRAAAGIARYVAEHPVNAQGKPGAGDPSLIIARDPRFLGELCVDLAANVASSYGVRCLTGREVAPTPAVAFEIMRRKTGGGINFTASHNPPEYNGIKYSTPDGAPALPEVTREVERLIEEGRPPRAGVKAGSIETVDLDEEYLAALRNKVDLDVIRNSGLKLAFDPFYGAARGYADRLLREAGIMVTVIHDRRDVMFGGHPPEPAGEHIGELRKAMEDSGAQLGIATDGDADRFGILDRDGQFISPNHIIGLLFDYLVETRGWRMGVAKSVATTNLVNALAEHHKVPLYETAVGFKYIGELIKADKIVIGGEESAGLSIYRHVPEKDGILACLLTAEMVARRGAPLSEQLDALFRKVGGFYPERVNLRLTGDVQTRFAERMKSDPAEFAGRKVKDIVRTDGLKLVLDDGSWALFRASGTEPVVRVYAEARSANDLPALIEEGKKFVFG